ncbi:MAG: T9SS type A sorting domain-containing protein [Saprospiraceae bacterium]|nr:T9SS type A sorting domain-containing protein [Saprospiraceae bacterium]
MKLSTKYLILFFTVLSAGWAQGQAPGATNESADDNELSPLQVEVLSTPVSCSSNSDCTGSVLITPTGGVAPYTITWADGFVGSERHNICTGEYAVRVVDTQKQIQENIVRIGYSTGCVWAGDADGDNKVTNNDILAIALTYGESGFERNSGTEFSGQEADDWMTVNPVVGLPNYKHVDTDGDGLITVGDASIIHQNYDKAYIGVSQAIISKNKQGNIPLKIQVDKELEAGERMGLPINLGTATELAEEVYGIAFTVRYNPEYVKMGSVFADFEDSWLSPDPLAFHKANTQEGTIDIAIARKDRVNNTGYGQLGTLFLTIRDDIFRTGNDDNLPDGMELSIENIRLIDKDNNELGTSTHTTTVDFVTSSEIIPNEAANNVSVFPNPSSDIVNVQSTQFDINQLELQSITGQCLKRIDLNQAKNYQLDLNGLAKGTYILSIQTTEKVLTKRLHIVK